MFKSSVLFAGVLAGLASGADLPVRQVILFKHGVGFFERRGELKPGDTAKLDFKAEDMNDVLKSLTISDRNGGKIGGIRYDASQPLEERLKDFPFAVGADSSLAVFLDQLKGSRLEMRMGSETVAGVIISARVIKGSDKSTEKETVTLLLDSGDMRSFDLAAAASVRLTDPKLQTLLKDYLNVLNQARSKDRRSIYIDSTTAGAKELIASYMTPAAVWKSSYRLLFAPSGDPTLEGWAIVDNTTGDDWTNVKLSVVSGRPISFISNLYEPKYVERPEMDLDEDRPVKPPVYQGAVGGTAPKQFMGPRIANSAPAPPASMNSVEVRAQVDQRVNTSMSTVTVSEGRDLGELFEYSFSTPVTVKKGESAMLPFLQQKVGGRKLLVFSEAFEDKVHPLNSAEITNSSGKTLDGGPITVYDNGTYAGEALVETVKAGDKRLISYGIDLGTRVTTKYDSSNTVVREVHYARGVLTSRSASIETKTFTINNVDPRAKTLIIEHPKRVDYKLLEPQKALEITPNAYRFEVKLAASGTTTFVLREEYVFEVTTSIRSMTPDVLQTWIQNKALSAAGRQQLQAILQKKSEIADNANALANAQSQINEASQDQERLRTNMQALNSIAGQQETVQNYARQLAAIQTKLATLRDQSNEMRRKATTLESQLASLMEKTDF